MDAAEEAAPALEALDRGDAAWFAGERRQGARAWREAVDLAGDDPDGRAVEAMARLRLLRAGSSLAPIWQGPPISRALRDCPTELCELAIVDFHLLAPAAVGAVPDEGVRRARALAPALPARAASRVALATGDLEPLRALEEPDGLGRALLAGLVPDPGPWALGVGLVAAESTGFGLGVHVLHPDLLRRSLRLGLDGWLATHSGGAGLSLRPRGPVVPVLDASFASFRWWDGEGWAPAREALVRPGLAARAGPLRVELGPQARWDLDTDGTIDAGHGAFAHAAVDLRGDGELPRGGMLVLGGEIAVPPLAEYARRGGSADLRGYLPAGRGVLAARVRGERAWGEMPESRLPTVGGTSVFRGARPGELRGDWTLAGDLELRHPVRGPLWVATFASGAVVEGEGAHPGGGFGIRWVLPPQPGNTVRLDLGVTDVGWEVVVGYGEAF